MTPAPGERLRRFVGDRLRFTLSAGVGASASQGWCAMLRTNLGRAEMLSREILQAHTKKVPAAGASWHDIPMRGENGEWHLELPLTEPGYFTSKAYLLDPQGWQHWPDGPDFGVSVHPDSCRTANTIYCAFTRMFGPTKNAVRTADPQLDEQLRQLDAKGYAVIPPSGTFRDLIQELPHIFDRLGCRILHLLPVNPVPTVFARFGRFGSPYASLDLKAIDPALVVFDKRTTGVDQFRELTYATHLKGGRVFLDIVINHTGWGSNIQADHPEWFLREPDGTFASPGAWGTIWEDLVELEHRHVELWDYLAEVFLTWCERGVDGFRCDAGYKVPLAAWQYIIARVRQEYPEIIFLLEGLGGAWETTELLLTEGGMQWAYSELFQNHSPVHISGYLDHALKQTERVGLLVNYSETHDNERLARIGRKWSLLRNRLCALASVSGGYGFTCGVEWLAPERVNVHSSRGLAWGNPDNIVAELSHLNRLLAEHPCFFEGAKLTRLSPPDSPVYVLRRDSEEGKDSVLVLVNNDAERAQSISLEAEALRGLGELNFELGGQGIPKLKKSKERKIDFVLEAGTCYCLAPTAKPIGLSGEDYRRNKAQFAWALTALRNTLPIEQIPTFDWQAVARVVNENPVTVLAACSGDAEAARANFERFLNAANDKKIEHYQQVVTWTLLDMRRITPVPPGHWLLISDTTPFRATLVRDGARQNVQSIAVKDGHVAFFAPTPGDSQNSQDAQLFLERYAESQPHVEAKIRFLAASNPAYPDTATKTPENESPSLPRSGGEGRGMEALVSNTRDIVGEIDAPLSGSLPARPSRREREEGPSQAVSGYATANLPVLRDIAATSRHVKSEAKEALPLEQPVVLLTNGIGGMARLCVDFGKIKSKYDCLLGANLNPRVPVDRHIFAKRARLWVNAGGFITPLDLRNLAHFEPGPPATWHFTANAGDGRTVEIKVTAAMLPGRNVTVLHFARPERDIAEKPLPDGEDVRLTVRVDIEDRNFHWETKRNDGADHHFGSHTPELTQKIGFAFTPAADRRLRVFSNAGMYHPQAEWVENIPHPVEQSRGQTGSGDAYSPGWFELTLLRAKLVSLVVSADAEDPSQEDVRASLEILDGRTPSLPRSGGEGWGEEALVGKTSDLVGEMNAPLSGSLPARPSREEERSDIFGQQLLRAAKSFVVRRDEGVTVIAGYPWFLDWGRDSLICARGLLAGGLVKEVRELLTTFARFEINGTLPNTIHGNDASNRDTSDAPLWFGMVCEETAKVVGNDLYDMAVDSTGRKLSDVLASIALNYMRGAPNGIRMDASSALIWSPSHFTWMDTNHPAGTPREGYPVEIQVLWIRLLRQLESIAEASERKRWGELAGQAQASLQQYFWLEKRGWLADLLIAKPNQSASEATVDNALRSNCLLAVSLGLLTGEPARRCVAAAQRYLVVPGALRTLAPLPVSPPLSIYGNQGQLLNDPRNPYWGCYEGDEDTRRKPAYHNGTAWTWTFPIFCEALARAWDFAPQAVAAARAYLGSMDRLMMEGCIGQLPEIIDGDAPHQQRGCDAQAWGATEALRVWKLLEGAELDRFVEKINRELDADEKAGRLKPFTGKLERG